VAHFFLRKGSGYMSIFRDAIKKRLSNMTGLSM
jgi:hypothetical protein